jgi:hypothetical protein
MYGKHKSLQDKGNQKKEKNNHPLIIPLFIQLIYESVLGIHITALTTPPSSPSSNGTDETAVATRVRTHVAITRGRSLATEEVS